ncbi:MAG: HXXEE domain-containing protein [Pseudomonadota bacterium]
MLERLFQNWAYATPPLALLLLGLYPFIGGEIALPLYLALPVYMIHQYEEHDNNRFADFLNGMMGPEKTGLSAANVWVINVIFVWFFLLGVFHAAHFAPEWGVIAAYLLAINGFVHVAWAVMFKRYNPGLWTSILLFMPLAVWIYIDIPASLTTHAVSAMIVIVLHAAIMLLARRPA